MTTGSAEETKNFACSFAEKLKQGNVVALYGDLGTGKTQFVKGVCRAFRVQTSATSPSFVILNRYNGFNTHGNEVLLYHFDLYRVKSIDELYDLGFEEYLSGDGICLIEWAELLQNLLPPIRYDVRLSFGKTEHERIIEITQLVHR